MIRQTWAIFVDAYRDLNARKLFWITLILTAVFVGAFALLGVNDKGLKVAVWQIDMPRQAAQYAYKATFRTVVIGLWLTWAATILALISTAGIFPDLITGGSIDLYLSKPLGRARLFITKYLAGLAFVSLQVLIVTLGGFLIMGLRGHEWLPKFFWAIPIVICFFSYLFGICVLLGVWTRSTIAALLVTIVAWGLIAGVDWSETSLLTTHKMFQAQADNLDARLAEEERRGPASVPAGEEGPAKAAEPVNTSSLRERAESARKVADWTGLFQRIMYGVKTVTPKTTDTIDLLNRYVFTQEEVDQSLNPPRPAGGNPRRGRQNGGPGLDDEAAVEGAKSAALEVHGRSPAWVIGSSLLFELAVVTLAGWVFVKRDY